MTRVVQNPWKMTVLRSYLTMVQSNNNSPCLSEKCRCVGCRSSISSLVYPGTDNAASLNHHILETQVTLADRQADENSPLYSAKTFEQLNLCVFSSCWWNVEARGLNEGKQTDILTSSKASMRWDSTSLPKFKSVPFPYFYQIRASWLFLHFTVCKTQTNPPH